MFTIVNGISNEVKILSISEAEKQVRRALKFIKASDKDQSKQFREGFVSIKEYIESLKSLFTEKLKRRREYRSSL